MKITWSHAILPAILLLSVLFSQPARGGEPPLETLVEGNSGFALDVYRQLSVGEGNLFFSPHSISTALSMTFAGARGDTEKQMAEALHFHLDRKDLHEAFAGLESTLTKAREGGHVTLDVANGLWPQKGYPLRDDYLSLVKKHYGVSITPVDYRTAAEDARGMINRWVEGKTRGKIQDLIQPGVLDPMTRLVLVNAIYFKGMWENRFKVEDTRDAPFHVAPGKVAQAPMMTLREEFGYADLDSLQILEMPYVGKGLSMVVLLPRKADGLREMEADLTPARLKEWRSVLRRKEVVVFLPRFRMTSMFRLDETLAALGMRDAFSPARADFSGMDGRKGWLHIGVVLHKAFVEVNEEGTEAAAATAVGIRATAMPAPPPEFRADHPFLFLILEKETGSILFMGRVTDPTRT
ncbi:MAG: serpin family protein [Syntrophobacteraceae bacterium]|jgi:serpin B|nr:serpin family protein [Syntrophobacteraceae bacterium]